ncbi:MAG: hypothetical protein KDH96_07800, partial [Candidatus Riesia sp.]|nr:hypothetical protein [Candidatus Riesia sp.]
MANPITFQGVAAPDFRSSNSMQNEAVKSLLLAGQQIKDAVGAYTQKRVDRNQALLQDYINQAKTPEELQSESFKQGYANLVSSFKGEVDPLKASGYLDGRLDSLTKRMADQTSIEANQFKLAQDKINAPIQTDLFRTQLGNAEEALRFAQANNPNVIAKNKVDADVALA